MKIKTGVTLENVQLFFKLKSFLYRQYNTYPGYSAAEINSFFEGLLFYAKENYCELLYLIDANNKWLSALIIFKSAASDTGYIGYFESVENAQAAGEILDVARELLKNKGCSELLVFFSPRMGDPKGFNSDLARVPAFGMPFCREYYPTLLKASGYEICKNLIQFDLVINDAVVKRLETASKFSIAKAKTPIAFRPIDLSKPEAEVALITEIYNSAWTDNWGAIRHRADELENEFAPMMKFMKSEYCYFAVVEEEAIGFIVIMPDFNVHKYHMAELKRGKVSHFLPLWRAIKAPKEYRGLFIGVKAEYRNRGVETCLINAVLPVIHNNILKIGWVLEDNFRWANQIRYIGAATQLREASFQVYSQEV